MLPVKQTRRRANLSPKAGWTVPVLLVRVLPRPENAAVRAAQETAAASLARVVLVSCDDLPSDGGDHLQPTGYATMAQRILTVLP